MIRTRRQLVEVSQAACFVENAAVEDAALLHVMSPSSCSRGSSVILDGIILPLADALSSPVPSRPKRDPLIQADSSLPNQALTSSHRLRQLLPPPMHLQFSPLPLPIHIHHLKVTTHVSLFLPSWQFHPIFLSQSISLHPEFTREIQALVPPLSRGLFPLRIPRPLSLRMLPHILLPHFAIVQILSRAFDLSSGSPLPPTQVIKTSVPYFPAKTFCFALQAVLDLACNWVRLLLICRDLQAAA
jgi:hypothetical protein